MLSFGYQIMSLGVLRLSFLCVSGIPVSVNLSRKSRNSSKLFPENYFKLYYSLENRDKFINPPIALSKPYYFHLYNLCCAYFVIILFSYRVTVTTT
jgi:hypothetical protein